jgi:hypothetical protein
MHRPEPRLVALARVRGIRDRCEGREGRGRVGVVGREGDVVCRVPVLGADFEGEGEGQEVVDCGDYGAAVGNGEGAVLWLGKGC